MTKKHYEKIARDIRYLMDGHAYHRYTPVGRAQIATLRSVVESLADTFAQENPRFDRETFFTACHYYDEQLAEHALSLLGR